MNINMISDAELYRKCCEIGQVILKNRRQFCGMLPEVERRKLYEKHGMHSIYEFASRLGGLSRDIVYEVLRIHQLLTPVPLLQEKLVSGEVGYTKLRAIALVVTPETQQEWLQKAQDMSKPALEMYVKEIKKDAQFQPGLPGKQPEKFSAFETLSVSLKSATMARLRVYKKRLERARKKPLNWDETLMALLEVGETRQKRKVKPGANRSAPNMKVAIPLPAKRYIPVAVRHVLEEKYHGVCAFPSCTRPADIFHHTERFFLNPHHDPATIVPLCKLHERIVHCSLVVNEEQAPEKWHVGLNPDTDSPKYFVDRLVQQHRMAPG